MYVVAAWGAITGASQFFPSVGGPAWAVEALAVVAILGLPIAGVIAWLFEATPDGIVRTRSVQAPPPETLLLGAHGFVRVTWHDAEGREMGRVLHQPFTIGREPDCEIRIDDPLVSRRHAEVGLTDGRWYVQDCGSRNGTFLDGLKITTRAPLPKRCAIRLSDQGPLVDLELRATQAATTALAPPRDG